MSTTATQQPPTHARRGADAAAPPAAGTTPVRVFDSPGGGVVDADTHEGLRIALTLIGQHGWECAAGRAVIVALQARCVRENEPGCGGNTQPLMGAHG